MFNRTKSHGFTLAEVLITLGIIGVVAALTLPNLIANYQKMVWATQLKKTVSTLEQGFQKLLADEGVDRLDDIDEIKKVEYNCCESNDTATAQECKSLFDLLNKYFNWEYQNFNSDEDDLITLNDGSQITWFEFHVPADDLSVTECEKAKSLGGNKCSEFIPTLHIDVNGNKLPNELGKDQFTFTMSAEGKIYPSYGKDDAIYIRQKPIENNEYYWRNMSNPNKFDLTARVVENGWKIDY